MYALSAIVVESLWNRCVCVCKFVTVVQMKYTYPLTTECYYLACMKIKIGAMRCAFMSIYVLEKQVGNKICVCSPFMTRSKVRTQCAMKP